MKQRTVAVLVVLAVFAGGSRAAAQTQGSNELSTPAVAECVAAHDRAGLLRHEDQWVEARAAMQRCADDACPIAIRSDCRAWLDELGAAMPTLLVDIERDDAGKQPVRLELDGQSLEISGKPGPIEVLPGQHRLRFTLEGYPAVEVDVTLAKGEKNHVVRARFLRPKVVAPPPSPKAALPAPKPTRPVPLSTYLYGGGSILAFATSAVLLGGALDSRANAREECAPGCPKARRDSIDRRLLISDLVGIAGLGLGGLAVYTYVRRPWVTESSAGPAIDVIVASDRAAVVVGGNF
jgi:hypothetical protein